MKALIYKELRLAMHPMCYLFITFFPLMILIPSYPIAVGFIYILSCYPVLFLGANKGQQSNDLLYSTLLPIRKKDIVKARIFTVAFIQFVSMLLMSALVPLALFIQAKIREGGGEVIASGLSIDGFVSILGIALLGFSLADLIYFSIYYKNGKSIVLSTVLTILGFAAYLCIFTVAIPYIPGAEGYTNFLCYSGLGYQFLVLGISLILYALIHYLVYRVASKELEQVDF